MTKKALFVLWGILFIVCAGLGFVPATGVVRGVFTLVSLAFFAPPGLLIYRAFREKDRYVLQLVRNLSLASLILTAVVLVLNLLSAMESELVGDLLYGILVVVSTPMVCSGYWALSLFLWACLLMTTLKLLQKK